MLLCILCVLTVGKNSILNFPAKITPLISRTLHGTSWKLMEQSQKEQGWRKRLISQPRGLPQTWAGNRVCFRPCPTTATHQLPPGWPQSPDAPVTLFPYKLDETGHCFRALPDQGYVIGRYAHFEKPFSYLCCE